MKTILISLCMMLSLCATAADKKPSPKRMSLSESELRDMAKAEPSVKNAGALHSVAMATSSNDDSDGRRQSRGTTHCRAFTVCCFRKSIRAKNHPYIRISRRISLWTIPAAYRKGPLFRNTIRKHRRTGTKDR